MAKKKVSKKAERPIPPGDEELRTVLGFYAKAIGDVPFYKEVVELIYAPGLRSLPKVPAPECTHTFMNGKRKYEVLGSFGPADSAEPIFMGIVMPVVKMIAARNWTKLLAYHGASQSFLGGDTYYIFTEGAVQGIPKAWAVRMGMVKA